jgi:hypothetical protein
MSACCRAAMPGCDQAAAGWTGIAGPADAPAITTLLRERYAAAREFRLLRPEVIGWDGVQGAGGVAAGWDASGGLVATMRASMADSAAMAAAAMGVSVALPAACFPAVILGRAATRPGLARGGINSLLRWHLLRAACAQGARAALGLVYEEAPRLGLMTAIGYRFATPARVWDDEVASARPPLLAWLAPDSLAPDGLAPDGLAPDGLAPDGLAHDGLADAVAALAPRVAQAAAAWPWRGMPPAIPRLTAGRPGMPVAGPAG